MTTARDFARRLGALPFEAAIGAIALYAGVTGLIGFGGSRDALELLLPAWSVFLFHAAYTLAGVSVLWGLGRGRIAPEAFGLVLVGTSVVVRSLALFWFLGVDPLAFSSVFPNGAFLAACVARFRHLGRETLVVRTS